MKNQILDQIIFDSEMTLEDELRELKEMPENFINSLYDISYDEMTIEEKENAITEVRDYLNKNFN